MATARRKPPIFIHIDYDCFYASVIENLRPELRGIPLGIQQKTILATCNYAARARGVKKLGSIREAKKICPELVIVNGEDLTPFRDASKKIFLFVRDYIWGNLVGRLGFDEMFLDVTEMIDYNMKMVASGRAKEPDSNTGYFYLSEGDSSKRFQFSWKDFPGYIYPSTFDKSEFLKDGETHDLHTRLFLAAYFASFLRAQVGAFFNYTASAGISTSMISAKLAGAVNKPDKQTVMVPASLQDFMDDYEVGKVPGIGHKLSGILRCAVAGVDPSDDSHEEPKTKVSVRQVRQALDRIQMHRLLGASDADKVLHWLSGSDDAPLSPTPLYPSQISIEDTFRNPSLTTLPQLLENLFKLLHKLIRRLRVELLSADESRWLAYPRTFRLQTATKKREYADGRISRSCAFPNYAFDIQGDVDGIVDKMVNELALPLLKKMLAAEGESKGWEIWLLNVAGVNMSTGGAGMDIQDMFRIAAVDASKSVTAAKEPEERVEDVSPAQGAKKRLSMFFKKDVGNMISNGASSPSAPPPKRTLPVKNSKAQKKNGMDIRSMFQRTPS